VKLEKGDGSQQNLVEIVPYARFAADEDDCGCDGFVTLGLCLRCGIGVARDLEAADRSPMGFSIYGDDPNTVRFHESVEVQISPQFFRGDDRNPSVPPSKDEKTCYCPPGSMNIPWPNGSRA
jgi:hypothetical protein